MARHELKTDPIVFGQTWRDEKLYEIRYDDRAFKVGDSLLLRETKHSGVDMATGLSLEYTGREILVYCVSILRGGIYGLERGWVIMSIVVREYRFTPEYKKEERARAKTDG